MNKDRINYRTQMRGNGLRMTVITSGIMCNICKNIKLRQQTLYDKYFIHFIEQIYALNEYFIEQIYALNESGTNGILIRFVFNIVPLSHTLNVLMFRGLNI